MPSANLDLNYGIIFLSPAMVAKDESVQLRIMLSGGIGNLTGFVILVMFPNGEMKDITANFAGIPTAYATPGFVVFGTRFAFSVPGHYSFFVSRTPTGFEQQWGTSVYCADWAARIDVPVSQLERQRADIQRVYSKVKK